MNLEYRNKYGGLNLVSCYEQVEKLQPATCFLYTSSEVRMVFTFSKRLKKAVIFCDTWKNEI